MKNFESVWEDLLGVLKKHPVLYAPETRKMQVIKDIVGDQILFTNDPTHKDDATVIKAEELRWVWNILTEKGLAKEADIRPLVGSQKAEFIWTVMDRLDYCQYDLRTLKLI